jgi:ubiquinone/menaquinone biosynthesis C-methylase UbiE
VERRGGHLFDRYAADYTRTVQDSIAFSGLSVEFFTRLKAEVIARVLRRLVRTPLERLRLLDVGCGVGELGAHLRASVPHIVGSDPSTASLLHAVRRNPGLHYVSGDAPGLPFRDRAFEAVTAVNVLHHVLPAARPAFLSEIWRVVAPGGLVLAIEHNPWNPLTRRAVRGCVLDRDAVLVSRGELKHSLSLAGLTPTVSAFIALLPSEHRVLQGIERLLGALPLGAQYYVAASKPLT